MIGTPEEAIAVHLMHWDGAWDEHIGPRITLAGQGEDRTVYRIGNVVYKVGTRDTANPYDHGTQEEARRRGYRWAPAASTLWPVRDYLSGEDRLVLAMPYLEDDGSTPDPALMAEMQAQAGGEVDGTNYVVIGGQPIVIDFCAVRLSVP